MRVSLYILLALVVLIVAAIMRMPASIAIDQILHRLNLPGDVTIRYTKGTIWEGQTQLNFRTFPSMALRWDVDAFRSFSALKVQVEMLSTSSHLSGLIQLNTNTISISDLSFFLASSDINQLAENYGHRFGSGIQGQGIRGAFELACIRALSGQLDWAGGRLSIDIGGGAATELQTPALEGELSAKDCGAFVSLSAVEQLGATADLSIDQTGWFKAIISPTLVSLVTNNPARGPMQFEAKVR